MKVWNTSRSQPIQTTSLLEESLKPMAVYCLSASKGLCNTVAAMLFAIESHSSSYREWPNHAFNRTRQYGPCFSRASVAAGQLT